MDWMEGDCLAQSAIPLDFLFHLSTLDGLATRATRFGRFELHIYTKGPGVGGQDLGLDTAQAEYHL